MKLYYSYQDGCKIIVSVSNVKHKDKVGKIAGSFLCCLCVFSYFQLFVTLWTVASQAPPFLRMDERNV